MTPVHLNRLSQFSNQLGFISKSSTTILDLVLRVKSAALLILTIVAAIFFYLIYCDPKGLDVAAPGSKSFNELSLSHTQKQSVKFIIENLAQKSKLQLLRNSREMKIQGNKIRSVHPLKFISFILSDAKLKNHLSTILNDRFKKMTFLRGLSQNLDKEHKNKNITPYLNGFLKSIRISLAKEKNVLKLIETNNWHKFFQYLKDN